MVDREPRAELLSSVPLTERELESHSLARSSRFLDQMLEEIARDNDFSQFHEVQFRYGIPFTKAKQLYPSQAVVILPFVYPSYMRSFDGYMSDDVYTLVGKRSKTSAWGQDSWAPPMGKIDEVDLEQPSQPLNIAVINAAKREIGEEVIKAETSGFMWISGSFVDTTTGTLIHVVVEEIAEPMVESKELAVEVASSREHSRFGWVKVGDFPKLSPMEMGSRFALFTTLQYVKEQNEQLIDREIA
jgi:hypothetical protein